MEETGSGLQSLGYLAPLPSSASLLRFLIVGEHENKIIVRTISAQDPLGAISRLSEQIRLSNWQVYSFDSLKPLLSGIL
jgi:hypothetical protein